MVSAEEEPGFFIWREERRGDCCSNSSEEREIIIGGGGGSKHFCEDVFIANHFPFLSLSSPLCRAAGLKGFLRPSSSLCRRFTASATHTRVFHMGTNTHAAR